MTHANSNSARGGRIGTGKSASVYECSWIDLDVKPTTRPGANFRVAYDPTLPDLSTGVGGPSFPTLCY